VKDSPKYNRYYQFYTQIWQDYFAEVLSKWKNAQCHQECADAIAVWVLADLKASDIMFDAFVREFPSLTSGKGLHYAWYAHKQANVDMFEAHKSMSRSGLKQNMTIPIPTNSKDTM